MTNPDQMQIDPILSNGAATKSAREIAATFEDGTWSIAELVFESRPLTQSEHEEVCETFLTVLAWIWAAGEALASAAAFSAAAFSAAALSAAASALFAVCTGTSGYILGEDPRNASKNRRKPPIVTTANEIEIVQPRRRDMRGPPQFGKGLRSYHSGDGICRLNL